MFRRGVLGLVWSAGMASLVVTGWLLLTPVRAFAGSCTAKCAGADVTCSGANCKATDYEGCSATGADGVETKQKCAATFDDGSGGGYGILLP